MRLLLTAILVLLASRAAVAEPIVTASNTLPASASSWSSVGAGIATDSGNRIGPVFDNRVAQTFTATVSGTLNDVSFYAKKHWADADLRIAVTPLVGGQPGAVLGTVLMDASSFTVENHIGRPDILNSVANFSLQNVQLHAGTQYAIVFSSDSLEANYAIYGNYSEYAAGTMMTFKYGGPFLPKPGLDVLFQATVLPVPEPSTITLAACGILGICVLRFLFARLC